METHLLTPSLEMPFLIFGSVSTIVSLSCRICLDVSVNLPSIGYVIEVKLAWCKPIKKIFYNIVNNYDVLPNPWSSSTKHFLFLVL